MKSTCCLLCVLAIAMLASCSYLKKDTRLLWKFEAPRKSQWSGSGVAAQPVLHGDLILYSGGYHWHNDVRLFAVDARTGKLNWATEDSIVDFLVAKDMVYASTQEEVYSVQPGLARKQKLLAIDIARGLKLWQQGPLNLLDNLRFFGAGTCMICVFDRSKLAAFEPKTGRMEWNGVIPIYKLNDGATLESAVILGDLVYTVQPNNTMQILSVETGDIVKTLELRKLPETWSEGESRESGHFPQVPIRRIKADDRFIYILDDDGFMTVFSPSSSAQLGPMPIGKVEQQPVFDSNSKNVYACIEETISENSDNPAGESSPDKNLSTEKLKFYICSFDTETGKQAWRTDIPAKIRFMPQLVGENQTHLLIVSESKNDTNQIHCLDISTGDIIWTKPTRMISAPLYHMESIFFNTEAELVALDLLTGTALWSEKPDKYGPLNSPIASGNLVYMVAADSNLYAFDAEKKSRENAKHNKSRSEKKSAEIRESEKTPDNDKAETE